MPRLLLQGIADNEGQGGAGGELDVALQWLDLLFARECRASGAAAATESGGAAGSGGSAAETEDSAAGATPGAQQPRQVQQPTQGARAGSPDGSLYERMLLQLLWGLQAALPPSSRVIARWAAQVGWHRLAWGKAAAPGLFVGVLRGMAP